MTEREIRAAFLNCTKGEAKRLPVPHDLDDRPWPDLDYLGWRDPGSPGRAYLVTELDGQPRAITLRAPGSTTRQPRRSICSLCVTEHSGGVRLMVAPKAGRAGQQGNSVGLQLCGDLACSLYVRGKKDTGLAVRLHESISVEEKIRRTSANLAAFLAKVTA